MASIQKRGNSYRIVVSMGYDVNHKKLVEITTFIPDKNLTPKKKQKAVEDFAYEFEKKCRNHERLEGEKTTLKDFISRWTAEKAQQELQPGTLEKYQAVIDSFILPALGHLKLSEIKPHTVNAFFVSLTKDGSRHDGKPGGYSKGTINKVSNVLSSILRTAVEWEAIERNPCDAVRVKAEDVGAYWQGDNWIFTQDDGRMMSYYTPYSALQDILTHYNADKAEADKLPMIPFHGLRHTKATLQIAAGTDVRTVSAILGHRETSTTMNIYSHSLQTAEQEAAANMERLLSKQA